MKKLSLLVLACLSVTNISHAAVAYDHSGDFYVPINFGMYSPDPARSLDNGSIFGAGLGYNINNYLAAQTNLFGLDMEQAGQNAANAPATGYYWNLEAKLNAANRTIFTPYAVAGAGALKITGAEFAWDYGVGLNIALSQNFSLDASWRQIRQTGPSMLDNVGMGGIVWTFGSASMPVMAIAPAPQPTVQQQMLAKAQTSLKPILPNGVVLCQGNQIGNQPGCVTFEGNQMIMHLNIKFKKAKADVQSKYGTSIQSLGSFMSAYPTTDVTLYGYASSEGKKAYNQKLSQNRALQVKKYLVNQAGIAPSRIQVMGMGTQNPTASNANETGRSLNRRVEATLPVPAQLVQVTN